MLVAYGILLVLYLALALLYAFTRKAPVSIPSWPLLTSDAPPLPEKRDCQHHSDCPTNDVCLKNECVPKFLKEGTCNEYTGQWQHYDMNGHLFAICQCKNEKLFAQPVFGADCDLSMACGIHGTYNAQTQSCDCEPGYLEKDLRCRKMSVMEYERTQPCASHETKVSQLKFMQNHPFHPDYIHSLDENDCVTNPCQFDALSGRLLPPERAFYMENWGCVCNPSYGLFGVQLLAKNKKYLKSEGFDACASIFKEDPENAMDVKLINYFYIKQHEPLSVLLFENVSENKLHPLFRNGLLSRSFMLSHTHWKYDFSQYFFSTQNIRVRIRKEDEMKSYRSVNRYYFEYYQNFKPKECSRANPNMSLKEAYNALYSNPICLAPDNDPFFGGRYIVTPEHILFQKYLDDTPRYNAYVLEYEADAKRWSVDLDYPYKVDFYRDEAEKGRLPNVEWYKKP